MADRPLFTQFRRAEHTRPALRNWVGSLAEALASTVPLLYGMFGGIVSVTSGYIMRHPAKKSTSMTLDGAVLEEARRLGINISQAAEGGVIAAIRTERARVWKEENAGAIADYNAFVEASGVPLAEFRKF